MNGARVLTRSFGTGASESAYAYDPQGVADLSQALVFDLVADRDLPINGALRLDLYARIDTPQTSILADISHVDLQGHETSVTSCVAGGRVEGPGYVHLVQPYCPAFLLLKKGERLRFRIASNFFPSIARDTNNAPGDDYAASRVSHIEILHSADHPSAVSLELEKRL